MLTNKSSSPRASTTVKAAALLMAVPALLAPMKVAAQQMAANAGPNFAACDALKDPAKVAQCYSDTDGAYWKARMDAANARGAAADARMAAADALTPCLEYLKGQKAAGKTFDRPITRDNACTVARSMGMQPN